MPAGRQIYEGYKKAPMDSIGDWYQARYTETIDGEIWVCGDSYCADYDGAHEDMKARILETAKRKFPKSVTDNG